MKNHSLAPRTYPALPKAGNTGRPAPRQGRPRGPVQPAQRPADAVPPARYDVMSAPKWTQALAPAVRPGANDHQRIKSLGLSC